MFLLIYQKIEYIHIIITNLTGNKNNIEAHHVNRDRFESPATTAVGGGEEGYAISQPGPMWPELPGSMWAEAVRWRGKKGPWLLGLRHIPHEICLDPCCGLKYDFNISLNSHDLSCGWGDLGTCWTSGLLAWYRQGQEIIMGLKIGLS